MELLFFFVMSVVVAFAHQRSRVCMHAHCVQVHEHKIHHNAVRQWCPLISTDRTLITTFFFGLFAFCLSFSFLHQFHPVGQCCPCQWIAEGIALDLWPQTEFQIQQCRLHYRNSRSDNSGGNDSGSDKAKVKDTANKYP